MKYRYTYIILLLCTAHLTVCAKPQYVFQSENPIANFAWDENDTSRYDFSSFSPHSPVDSIQKTQEIQSNVVDQLGL